MFLKSIVPAIYKYDAKYLIELALIDLGMTADYSKVGASNKPTNIYMNAFSGLYNITNISLENMSVELTISDILAFLYTPGFVELASSTHVSNSKFTMNAQMHDDFINMPVDKRIDLEKQINKRILEYRVLCSKYDKSAVILYMYLYSDLMRMTVASCIRAKAKPGISADDLSDKVSRIYPLIQLPNIQDEEKATMVLYAYLLSNINTFTFVQKEILNIVNETTFDRLQYRGEKLDEFGRSYVKFNEKPSIPSTVEIAHAIENIRKVDIGYFSNRISTIEACYMLQMDEYKDFIVNLTKDAYDWETPHITTDEVILDRFTGTQRAAEGADSVAKNNKHMRAFERLLQLIDGFNVKNILLLHELFTQHTCGVLGGPVYADTPSGPKFLTACPRLYSVSLEHGSGDTSTVMFVRDFLHLDAANPAIYESSASHDITTMQLVVPGEWQSTFCDLIRGVMGKMLLDKALQTSELSLADFNAMVKTPKGTDSGYLIFNNPYNIRKLVDPTGYTQRKQYYSDGLSDMANQIIMSTPSIDEVWLNDLEHGIQMTSLKDKLRYTHMSDCTAELPSKRECTILNPSKAILANAILNSQIYDQEKLDCNLVYWDFRAAYEDVITYYMYYHAKRNIQLSVNANGYLWCIRQDLPGVSYSTNAAWLTPALTPLVYKGDLGRVNVICGSLGDIIYEYIQLQENTCQDVEQIRIFNLQRKGFMSMQRLLTSNALGIETGRLMYLRRLVLWCSNIQEILKLSRYFAESLQVPDMYNITDSEVQEYCGKVKNLMQSQKETTFQLGIKIYLYNVYLKMTAGFLKLIKEIGTDLDTIYRSTSHRTLDISKRNEFTLRGMIYIAHRSTVVEKSICNFKTFLNPQSLQDSISDYTFGTATPIFDAIGEMAEEPSISHMDIFPEWGHLYHTKMYDPMVIRILTTTINQINTEITSNVIRSLDAYYDGVYDACCIKLSEELCVPMDIPEPAHLSKILDFVAKYNVGALANGTDTRDVFIPSELARNAFKREPMYRDKIFASNGLAYIDVKRKRIFTFYVEKNLYALHKDGFLIKCDKLGNVSFVDSLGGLLYADADNQIRYQRFTPDVSLVIGSNSYEIADKNEFLEFTKKRKEYLAQKEREDYIELASVQRAISYLRDMSDLPALLPGMGSVADSILTLHNEHIQSSKLEMKGNSAEVSTRVNTEYFGINESDDPTVVNVSDEDNSIELQPANQQIALDENLQLVEPTYNSCRVLQGIICMDYQNN